MNNSPRQLTATRYVLTIYGFQTNPNFLRTAHTWAIAQKQDSFDDGSESADSPQIIGWLPASGVIQLVGLEKGKLYSYADTVAWAERVGATICQTAMTEIAQGLYDSFVERIQQLASGTIMYVMSDNPSLRPDKATNCIHAVSDLKVVLASQPMLDTGWAHGCRASFMVYKSFRPWFSGPPVAMAGGHGVLTEKSIQQLDEDKFRQEEAVFNLIRSLQDLST